MKTAHGYLFRQLLNRNRNTLRIFSVMGMLALLLGNSGCTRSNGSILISPTLGPNQITESITLSPSASASLTNTLDPLSSSPILQNCWSTKPYEETTTLSGSLLYLDPDTMESQVFDTSTHNSKELGVKITRISDDYRTIANFDSSLNNLHLLSQEIDLVYRTPDNVHFDMFLEGDRVRLALARSLETNYKEGSGSTDEYYILSSDTGRLTHESLFLPYYWTFGSARNSFAIYSSDLHYVMYSADYQGEITNILFDIDKKEIIWKGGDEFGFPYLPFPIWRQDNSALTIIQRNEAPAYQENFHDIFTNGKIAQLTHLEKILKAPYSLAYPKWSPNGRFLAFTITFPSLSSDQSKMNYLVVFDTEKNILMSPCIALGYSLEGPLWSPDGNELAVVPWDKSRILVVDLITESVYQVYKYPGVDIVDVYSNPDAIPVQLFGWVNWGIP